MTYWEYFKKQLNKSLNEQVAAQKAEEASGGSSGSGANDVNSSPLTELEAFIKEQYATPLPPEQTLPDVPSYERMEVSSLSDEEIAASAKSSLEAYANQSQNAIEDDIAALEKKYNADKETAKSNYETQEKSIESIYEGAKESASNDMLKRGLARSSISANIVSGLETEAANKRTEVLNAYIQSVAALDGEISALEGKRQKAINDFNISYAAKLTEQINKLTEKRDDEIKEALKYNNSLTEKEYEQTTQKELDESKLYTDELTQAQKSKELGTLTNSQQEQIYKNTYDKMDELLGSMSASEAKELLENSSLFRQYLNDYYYYKLYDRYGR